MHELMCKTFQGVYLIPLYICICLLCTGELLLQFATYVEEIGIYHCVTLQPSSVCLKPMYIIIIIIIIIQVHHVQKVH